MAVRTIKREELNQVGFELVDNQLHTYNNRVCVTVVDIATGKLKTIYLAKGLDAELPNPLLPGAKIPDKWVFLEITNPDTPTFYMLGVDKSKKKGLPLIQEYSDPALPVKTGDSIRLRDEPKERYQVLFASLDLLVVSSNKMCIEYTSGYIDLPSKIVYWGDFESKV